MKFSFHNPTSTEKFFLLTVFTMGVAAFAAIANTVTDSSTFNLESRAQTPPGIVKTWNFNSWKENWQSLKPEDSFIRNGALNIKIKPNPAVSYSYIYNNKVSTMLVLPSKRINLRVAIQKNQTTSPSTFAFYVYYKKLVGTSVTPWSKPMLVTGTASSTYKTFSVLLPEAGYATISAIKIEFVKGLATGDIVLFDSINLSQDNSFPTNVPCVKYPPADYNQDGVINGFDYVLWFNNHPGVVVCPIPTSTPASNPTWPPSFCGSNGGFCSSQPCTYGEIPVATDYCKYIYDPTRKCCRKGPTPTPTTSQSSCSDTDGGRIYNVRGTVTYSGNTGMYTDACSTNTLIEYFCEGTVPKKEAHVCATFETCLNGACNP